MPFSLGQASNNNGTAHRYEARAHSDEAPSDSTVKLDQGDLVAPRSSSVSTTSIESYELQLNDVMVDSW